MDISKTDRVHQITPNGFEILLALAGGDKHGYAIMLEVNAFRNNSQRLGPGTLYRSIKQLHDAGLIEESGGLVDATTADERRRYYRLTRLGRRILKGEAERLARLVNDAAKRGLLRRLAL